MPLVAAARETTYRGHTISPPLDSFLGVRWIRGPLVTGGAGTVAACKSMIDESFRQAECKESTGHADTETRPTSSYLGATVGVFCKACGKYLGHPYEPGQGARWTFFRTAANGVEYGYTVKADREGKWFAIERPKRGKARLVKCATRTKAKARATKWWLDAEGRAS